MQSKAPAGNVPQGLFRAQNLEATTGIEPVYAVLQTAPWTTRARRLVSSLAAPRGFEPRFTDPKSAVLPLDDGAANPPHEASRYIPGEHSPRGKEMERKTGLEPATLTLAR